MFRGLTESSLTKLGFQCWLPAQEVADRPRQGRCTELNHLSQVTVAGSDLITWLNLMRYSHHAIQVTRKFHTLSRHFISKTQYLKTTKSDQLSSHLSPSLFIPDTDLEEPLFTLYLLSLHLGYLSPTNLLSCILRCHTHLAKLSFTQ